MHRSVTEHRAVGNRECQGELPLTRACIGSVTEHREVGERECEGEPPLTRAPTGQ